MSLLFRGGVPPLRTVPTPVLEEEEEEEEEGDVDAAALVGAEKAGRAERAVRADEVGEETKVTSHLSVDG